MVATLTPENLLSSPLTGKKGAAYKRYQKLEDDRSSWRTQWIEITDYLLPRRGRYLIESQNSKGRRRNNKILDNTGGHALRTLSAGMMSGLTSPARPWFKLQTQDPNTMDAPGVRDWLGLAEMRVRSVLSSSNFYNMASTIYTELGAFGTGATLRRRHPNKLVHFRPYTAGEYVIAENEFGQVDTIGRKFTMTVAQIVEQFIWDKAQERFNWEKASPTLKRLWDRQNYDELIQIIHMIQPRRRENIDLRKMDGLNRPYADLYFELGSDNDVFLQEGGYNRLPVYVPRWDTLGGDVYGYGPGMDHLGDIKQLQHEQRRKAQAIDKMVNPPMRAANALKGKPTTVLPGGVTYIDPANGEAGFAPVYQVRVSINEMMMDIQEVQQRIQRGFYADLFAMMINSDRRMITATEVVERHEEKLVLLGPVLQRLNSEFLDPLIEDVLLMVMEEGLLPPPPEALQEAEVEVKYISLLAQAQEAVAASAIERGMSFAGNLAAISPDIMDNIDTDEAFMEYAQIIGVPASMLRDESARTAIREARAAEMRRQQEMEMAQQAAGTAAQGAQAAELLSRADAQGPNVLQQLLGQAGGGPSPVP